MLPPPHLQAVKVLDQLRERIRYWHDSLRREDIYVYWIPALIRFHGVRHPATMGAGEAEEFISWRANSRQVAEPPPQAGAVGIAFLLWRTALQPPPLLP